MPSAAKSAAVILASILAGSGMETCHAGLMNSEALRREGAMSLWVLCLGAATRMRHQLFPWSWTSFSFFLEASD